MIEQLPVDLRENVLGFVGPKTFLPLTIYTNRYSNRQIYRENDGCYRVVTNELAFHMDNDDHMITSSKINEFKLIDEDDVFSLVVADIKEAMRQDARRGYTMFGVAFLSPDSFSYVDALIHQVLHSVPSDGDSLCDDARCEVGHMLELLGKIHV